MYNVNSKSMNGYHDHIEDVLKKVLVKVGTNIY